MLFYMTLASIYKIANLGFLLISLSAVSPGAETAKVMCPKKCINAYLGIFGFGMIVINYFREGLTYLQILAIHTEFSSLWVLGDPL